jgi:hypothetical protein
MASDNRVLKAYLRAYKKLVETELISEKSGPRQSIALSIPLHIAANHRVEVTVTEFHSGKFILSDMAKTLSDLSESGKRITADFRKRAEEIAKYYGASFRLDHLIMESDEEQLGNTIQRFAEACKTIGDANLIDREHVLHARQIVDEVKRIFVSRNLSFKEDQSIKGAVEKHSFDIYVPPNGRPGIAVKVVAGHNTHALAKIWAFNCWDVREANSESRLRLGLVLDEEDSEPWSKNSQKILQKGADIVARSNDLNALEHGLMLEQII